MKESERKLVEEELAKAGWVEEPAEPAEAELELPEEQRRWMAEWEEELSRPPRLWTDHPLIKWPLMAVSVIGMAAVAFVGIGLVVILILKLI